MITHTHNHEDDYEKLLPTNNNEIKMVDWWFVVVLVLLFYLFVFVLIVLRLTYVTDDSVTKQNIDRSKLKSGDIISVSYRSRLASIIKFFTGSLWTHSALVLKVGDDVNVVEVLRMHCDKTDTDKNGVIIRSLDEFLEYNESKIVAIRQYQGTNFPVARVMKIVELSNKVEVDLNLVNWLKTLVKRDFKHPLKRKILPPHASIVDTNEQEVKLKKRYYCSEYIAFILQESGVIKKRFIPDGYKPWELLYGRIDFNKEHIYSKKFFIVN